MKFKLFINTEIVKINGNFRLKLTIQSFILLINVKMPTVIGILTFMSRINFMLSCIEHEKSFNLQKTRLQEFLAC